MSGNLEKIMLIKHLRQATDLRQVCVPIQGA